MSKLADWPSQPPHIEMKFPSGDHANELTAAGGLVNVQVVEREVVFTM